MLTENQIRDTARHHLNIYNPPVIEFINTLVRLNNRTIDDVALDMVKKHGHGKKIQAIKDLRIEGSYGLKEAKEAVERATVTYLQDALDDARDVVRQQNPLPSHSVYADGGPDF
jgi:hypothetical protein